MEKEEIEYCKELAKRTHTTKDEQIILKLFKKNEYLENELKETNQSWTDSMDLYDSAKETINELKDDVERIETLEEECENLTEQLRLMTIKDDE